MNIAKISSVSDGERTPQTCKRCGKDIFGVLESLPESLSAKCVNCGEPLQLEGEHEIEKIVSGESANG